MCSPHLRGEGKHLRGACNGWCLQRITCEVIYMHICGMCSPHLRGEASTCGVLATDHLRGDRRRICGMRCAHLRGESKHLRGAYGRLPARWSWTYLRGVSSAFVAFWHLRGVCLRDHHHGDSACYMRAERACKPRHVSICISKHSICFDARFEHNIYIYTYTLHVVSFRLGQVHAPQAVAL